jgi:hypothetical protein
VGRVGPDSPGPHRPNPPKKLKTYNSGDSPILTNSTTNPPVHCLYMAERTGSLVFSVLWSYVKRHDNSTVYIHVAHPTASEALRARHGTRNLGAFHIARCNV